MNHEEKEILKHLLRDSELLLRETKENAREIARVLKIVHEIEREVRQPGDANYLREARIASGGLDDDPTDSGSVVKNRHSSANLQGGR